MSLDEAVVYALTVAETPEDPGGSPDAGRQSAAAAAPSDSLTPREREVVGLLCRGLTNRQIADELVITEGTAAIHVKHILRKLDLGSRAQVVAWAMRRGLVAAPAE
jgi:two-component system nitrate/nitrite response regulator NarL